MTESEPRNHLQDYKSPEMNTDCSPTSQDDSVFIRDSSGLAINYDQVIADANASDAPEDALKQLGYGLTE